MSFKSVFAKDKMIAIELNVPRVPFSSIVIELKVDVKCALKYPTSFTQNET